MPEMRERAPHSATLRIQRAGKFVEVQCVILDSERLRLHAQILRLPLRLLAI